MDVVSVVNGANEQKKDTDRSRTTSPTQEQRVLSSCLVMSSDCRMASNHRFGSSRNGFHIWWLMPFFSVAVIVCGWAMNNPVCLPGE